MSAVVIAFFFGLFLGFMGIDRGPMHRAKERLKKPETCEDQAKEVQDNCLKEIEKTLNDPRSLSK